MSKINRSRRNKRTCTLHNTSHFQDLTRKGRDRQISTPVRFFFFVLAFLSTTREATTSDYSGFAWINQEVLESVSCHADLTVSLSPFSRTIRFLSFLHRKSGELGGRALAMDFFPNGHDDLCARPSSLEHPNR